MSTPFDYASKSEYYKRNHLGKVACTLCGVSCNDDNNFMKHLAGKRHSVALERIEATQRRKRRLREEEERNRVEWEKAQQEQEAAQLLAAQLSQGGAAAPGPSALTGPHGVPRYEFRTEHDPVRFLTKVWLEFYFPHAEEGTRAVHRWVSAREQQLERVGGKEEDYFVYLLVACEGYTTAALKFPAEARRTTAEEEQWRQLKRKRQRELQGGEEENSGEEEEGAPLYRSTWNPLRRQYSIFFELYR